MARWCGEIGFGITSETSPGVWTNEIIQRKYYGDMIRNYRRIDGDTKVNNDITLTMELSIVADPFAYEHFHTIKYAVLYGVKWKVTTIELKAPRLYLNLGGVYNA